MEGADDVYDIAGRTILHPVGLTVLLVLGLLTIALPRKYAIFPMIVHCVLISPGQRIMIGPANFHFLRIMLIFASFRILARGEFSAIKLSRVDWLVVSFAIIKLVIYTLQWGTVQAFIYQAGQSYDVFGIYFFFRCLVRSFDDLRGLAYSFVLVSIPSVFAFISESTTRVNMFSVFGGVPPLSDIREGKIRCQGAFPHALMAGVFFASSLPLVAARWFDATQNKLMTLIGVGCIVVITLTTNSSTSIMVLVLAVVGACFYPLRMKMRQVRWAILGLLVLAQLTMQNGVVYLISKLNILGGSTGWHRSYLMDRCIVYFPEWALLGTQDTKHWAEGTLGGVGLADVTNQYIIEGVRGGFVTMLLFVAIIVLTYRNVGKMLRSREVLGNRTKTIYVYSLGVILMIHTVSFFSVSYFGQSFLLIWLAAGVAAGLRQSVVDVDQRSIRALKRSNSMVSVK